MLRIDPSGSACRVSGVDPRCASQLAPRSPALTGVRLGLDAGAPSIPFSEGVVGSLAHSLSRRIVAKEAGAFQARLEKHPLPTATLGSDAPKARRSRGFRQRTRECSNRPTEPAFVGLVGFVVQEETNNHPAKRLICAVGAGS
jgi:hypothetical protein